MLSVSQGYRDAIARGARQETKAVLVLANGKRIDIPAPDDAPGPAVVSGDAPGSAPEPAGDGASPAGAAPAEPGAPAPARVLLMSLTGQRAEVFIDGMVHTINFAIPGIHNQLNACAALALSLEVLGQDADLPRLLSTLFQV